MELGNVGTSVTITDNLVIDGMSFGADQSDAQRLDEFNMHGETDASGNNKIVWIGSVPNDSTAFVITSYSIHYTKLYDNWAADYPLINISGTKANELLRNMETTHRL